MQKIYVLDTNVLLCDPASILSFTVKEERIYGEERKL